MVEAKANPDVGGRGDLVYDMDNEEERKEFFTA
jgi:hypothetical protein